MVIVEKSRLTWILSIGIILTLNNSIFCQQNSTVVDFLSYKLIDKDKKTLVDSINKLTKNMRKEKWEIVYDLLSEGLKEKWTKEEFIQETKEDSKNPLLDLKVIGFKPESFFVINDEKMREVVHVSGCIKVVIKGNRFDYLGTVDAKRIGTEKWYFTSLPIVNPNSTTEGPKPCE